MYMDFEFALYSEKFGYYFVPDEEEPIGWDGFKLILRRHDKFHGIFPEISLKLKWFCGARNYILRAYEDSGIEAVIKCYIFHSCNGKKEIIYEGLLDFSDLTFTERFAECNIKQSDCTQLFLDRLDIPVNLYDDPCFTELTYDKTAYRTRYKFCPYWIAFPERSMYGLVQWELHGCKQPARLCVGHPDIKQWTANKFQLNGGLGCSLIIATDPTNPATYQICGNTDPPENNDGAKSNFQVNGNHLYYIVNGVKLRRVLDDLDMLNEGYDPPGFQAATNATNNIQFRRDCGNNLVPTEQQYDFNKEYNGVLEDCNCCPDVNGNPCKDFVVDLEITANMVVFLDIVEGVVEWYEYQHELVFEFGNYQVVLASSGKVQESNSCNGWDVNSPTPIVSCCGGSPGCLSFKGQLLIPTCDVPAGSKFRIYTRTLLGFKAGGGLLGNSNLSIQVFTNWVENKGRILAPECNGLLPRVGETSHPVYMVHEAFSRIVEHYTNNCLRVKSNLFARPNSMEWGDNCEIQNSSIRYGAPYNTIYKPLIEDECGNLVDTERVDTPCAYAVSDCDCNNPQGFPYCNPTFNIAPYQQNTLAPHYFDEAFTTITSGISLRDFGTECFVSFNELFDAMNALYCIGVGYSYQDVDNIQIERIDYFYNPDPILDLGNLDLYKSKFKISVMYDEYFNKFKIGYTTWLQEELNTIDEFNTVREYALPIKNTENTKEQLCKFIASGYSIEWQRRQRYSIDSSLDSEKFVICVGRSVNVTNATTLTLPNNTTITLPNHIYRAEIGVDSSSGIIDPATVYNWRISPYAMARHWAPVFAPVIWHKLDNTPAPLEFAAGETNFLACGSIINNNDPSVQPAVSIAPHCENDNVEHNNEYFYQPEEITFEYPLSVSQLRLIKMKPYNAIIVNKKPYYLKSLEFSFTGNSKLTLIKARRN